MTNNTTDIKTIAWPVEDKDPFSNASLERRQINHLPGTMREAGNLLRMPEDRAHRLTVTAEAHLAANMTGGRYNDHLESIISLYLASNDKELYIQDLRDGQRRLASHRTY